MSTRGGQSSFTIRKEMLDMEERQALGFLTVQKVDVFSAVCSGTQNRAVRAAGLGEF